MLTQSGFGVWPWAEKAGHERRGGAESVVFVAVVQLVCMLIRVYVNLTGGLNCVKLK